MAQKVHIELVDDLDGSVAVETVAFGLDGRSYEIDLNKKNADKLRKAVGQYVEGGRRVAQTGRKKGAVSTAKVREWARSQGMDVSDRGAISNEVKEAYSAVH